MPTSALPRAIEELVSVLQASNALEGVVVLDGPPTDDVATEDILAVGWSTNEDTAAELTQDFNAAGARTRNEDFAIACVVDAWSGDDGFATVRARVFDIFGVVETELRATGGRPEAPNLNGAVLWAHITRGVLRQYFTDQGARVALAFTVTCHARI